jgi:excisionase family DNA binding protein
MTLNLGKGSVLYAGVFVKRKGTHMTMEFELIIVLVCVLFFIAIIGALALLVLRSRPSTPGAREQRDDDASQIMTITEVAALLRVDTETVEDLIEDGRLPAVKVGPDWRISMTNVVAFINAGDKSVGKGR